jgi:uncharacterized membrane protein
MKNRFQVYPMDKKVKNGLSLICFVAGFILVMTQDLRQFSTMSFGFSWPYAAMFYLGLLLMAFGYYLRG